MYNGRPGFGGPPPQYPAGMYPGGGVPMKSTTLYVGRIAPSVEDSVLRELLEACGEVQVWKPTLDPDTSKFKGFGFCTYAEPEGVSIAIRVLNNLNVDGQQLIAKTNKATQEYLDWVEREKQHQRATPGAAAAAGGEGTPDPTTLENAALEKVMGILSQRAPQQLAEQPEPGEAVAAASDFLAGLQSTSTLTAQQEPPGCVVSCGPSARPQPTKEEERELLRRQREEQRRREDEDQAYRESERAWEAIERTQQREREREADKERDLLKERARAIHADNSGVGSDDEEIWRRKWYSQRWGWLGEDCVEWKTLVPPGQDLWRWLGAQVIE
ncbi:RNA-binding protein 25 [Auxenochlorella protothecoides]|uniref:RNA-binding protein 25 n=1 Tax=Auxenochlorella protothecoides TaxID=3075 RepID=A0A087SH96_AUXPR|nr:RNA-binding protein 25 [Auxenochlorella protothecoides]KFM25100.1 RNA-binding protein 25 [Auxenochlorella protothecoides]